MRNLSDPYGEADRKKAKREWHWCRRHNGFSDMPTWRLVARRANTSLVTVLAFVNRLEELANSAGNFGRERGSVESFDAEEFALALDIGTEEAARIRAALEDEKVNWIAFDHLVTFYDRNKDREEDAASVNARKRRSRTYAWIREQLAKLSRLGKITPEQRLAIEVTLKGISGAELDSLRSQLARAELSAEPVRSQRSQSDAVTVTPEHTRNLDQTRMSDGDNSGDGARGNKDGLPGQVSAEASAELEQATRWIDGEGKKLLVERATIVLPVAETQIERWRRDLRDDVALARIIKGVAVFDFKGATFRLFITDQVDKLVRANGQRQLALPPTGSIAGSGAGNRAAGGQDGHNVTSLPVDNAKRSAS